MRLRVILFVGLLCIFFSCKKEDPIITNNNSNNNTTTEQEYRTIKVTVRHAYELNPVNDSTVRGVRVRLFKSGQDRDANIGFEAERYTDSTGVVVITHRKENFYYIRTDHPQLGPQFKEVSTPAGTYSFVEILY